MKRSIMALFLVVGCLAIMVATGCSKIPAKPSAEIQSQFAAESFWDNIRANNKRFGNADSPTPILQISNYKLKKLSHSQPNKAEERLNKDGVKKMMWSSDVDAEVELEVRVYGMNAPQYVLHRAHYTLYFTENAKGEPVYEAGIAEVSRQESFMSSYSN